MADTEAMLERMEAIERRNAELEAENEVLRSRLNEDDAAKRIELLEGELSEAQAVIQRLSGLKELVYEMMTEIAQRSAQTMSRMEDVEEICDHLHKEKPPSAEQVSKSKAMEQYVRPNLEDGRLAALDEIDE